MCLRFNYWRILWINQRWFRDLWKRSKLAVKKNVIVAVLTSSWFYFALLIIILPHISPQTSYIFYSVDYPLLFIQFKVFPVSNLIIKAYDKFFKHRTLNDLPDKPVIAINSTNLESGRPFTFSAIKWAIHFDYPDDESEPIRFKSKIYPISNAVMASTCVPMHSLQLRFRKDILKWGKLFKGSPALDWWRGLW